VALGGLAAIAGAAGILALQARGVSVDAMIARYTADTLTEGVGTRFRSWGRALAAIDYTTFTIGKPWTYELFGEREAYPHNIYLSTALYAGLAPLLVLVVVTGMALLQPVRRWDEVAVKGAFIIALVYTMFSGNMTRVMTIFALLAVLEATRANDNESLAMQGQGNGEGLCPVKSS
jgi:O-antigen ligase